MKRTLTDQIKDLFKLGKRYATLQVECIRLSAAEKLTILLSALALGLIAILMLSLIIFMLAFMAAALFGEVMSPALAYLCAAGSILLILVLIFLLRKPLLINPLARLITKALCPKKPEEKPAEEA